MQTAISTLHVGLQQNTAGLQMLHENSSRFKRVWGLSDEKKNCENLENGDAYLDRGFGLVAPGLWLGQGGHRGWGRRL